MIFVSFMDMQLVQINKQVKLYLLKLHKLKSYHQQLEKRGVLQFSSSLPSYVELP